VGCFPQGTSPYGCLDMTGNVWEWTRSLWGKEWNKPDFRYPYQPDDGREQRDAPDDFPRVLRGGSYWDFQRRARCACRHRGHPYNRYDDVGFRLVVRP
jgi:formylglycine-generating enzyme required for sulfatase activity